ncbi:hypothetical protein [Algoriphagus sp.]|uniref:hypothetical protein n=1 Tax=Algoriphagus sp. TaxID=1872435 RepID=UPI003919161F
MLKFSRFHFGKAFILTLSVLSMALFSIDASAQSENEKVLEVNAKNNDRVILEDLTVIQDTNSQKTIISKTTVTQKSPINTLKKESINGEIISEKEAKRNESPSTLSFNIFLYIVDKFKAD